MLWFFKKAELLCHGALKVWLQTLTSTFSVTYKLCSMPLIIKKIVFNKQIEDFAWETGQLDYV